MSKRFVLVIRPFALTDRKFQGGSKCILRQTARRFFCVSLSLFRFVNVNIVNGNTVFIFKCTQQDYKALIFDRHDITAKLSPAGILPQRSRYQTRYTFLCKLERFCPVSRFPLPACLSRKFVAFNKDC